MEERAGNLYGGWQNWSIGGSERRIGADHGSDPDDKDQKWTILSLRDLHPSPYNSYSVKSSQSQP
jgi:hypothetical protein